MNVLTLVGSLRADSINRRLAEASHAHLPEGITSQFQGTLSELPFYSEDLDVDGQVPDAVRELREAVAAAEALIVVTPEYNGSISGVLKNAIDWLSRPREAAALAGKRTVVLSASASPRAGQWAREGAVRILSVAGADVLPQTVGVPSAYSAFTPEGRLLDETLDAELAAAVRALTTRDVAAV